MSHLHLRAGASVARSVLVLRDACPESVEGKQSPRVTGDCFGTPAPSASLRECEADVAGGAREERLAMTITQGQRIENMSDRQYCVYIMTNTHNTVLYTGVTNNLQRRVLEHKSGTGSKFSNKYNVDKLVYFECGDDVNAAIAREKQIKAGSRKKKMDLVNSMNSEWKDLFGEFFK